MNFDKVYWKWLCSLHLASEKEVIDPLKRSCQCGYTWHFGKLDYMKMILLDGVTVTCPRCQRKHRYKLVYHAVEEFNETRIENNELEESKQNLYNHP